MSRNLVGKSAIVTGGGSGIGAALTRALVAAGADVMCTDIDIEAAKAVAQSSGGPGTVDAERLDVTDAAAVQATVDEVVERRGRLDLMFNNAGVFFGGDTELLTLDQWNTIIDINICGVVHGVSAAYPVMIAQQSGHIINTASMAGLAAAGQITSYVMTKHAVVGLSLALRTEAAAHGIGVLAICPGAVETPIISKGAVGAFDGRRFFTQGQGSSHFLDPDTLARETLRAIDRNRALLVTPMRSRMAWRLARFAPGLLQTMSIRFVAQSRRREQEEHR